MNSRISKAACAFMLAGLLAPAAGFTQMQQDAQMQHDKMMEIPNKLMPEVIKAICVLTPTEGSSASGTVTFTQTDAGVLVEAHVTGLAPGKHGFHIHEFGDGSALDASSAGGHFNPVNRPHAGPSAEMRHAGDLGNLEADGQGVADYNWTDPQMHLNGPMSIIGRAVIVHLGEDDLTSQPTGNAGARAACGVIGIARNGLK